MCLWSLDKKDVGPDKSCLGLDPESLLEGGDGADISWTTKFRENNFCQCHSGNKAISKQYFYSSAKAIYFYGHKGLGNLK